jgi:hypothetical protein
MSEVLCCGNVLNPSLRKRAAKSIANGPPAAPENKLDAPRPPLPVAVKPGMGAPGVGWGGDCHMKRRVAFPGVKQFWPFRAQPPINEQLQGGPAVPGLGNRDVDKGGDLLGHPQALDHFRGREAAPELAFSLLEAGPFQGTQVGGVVVEVVGPDDKIHGVRQAIPAQRPGKGQRRVGRQGQVVRKPVFVHALKISLTRSP